ncbi:MAG: 6,7-dimethyl-8-ribityllumazine synthase [Gemmatimonadota bacterium]|nr:6,7-dimethyl-8-ribityllumazine synthase [Gemmatimonadota bacterium]
MDAYRGTLDATGLRIAVVVSRFNAEVTDRLLAGARAALEEFGADPDLVDVFAVPGAWELPQAAARVVAAGGHDAVITLGCVIRGETPHFHYVCSHASHGLGSVAVQSEVPVVFGVLTTDDLDQALARAGDGADNKGFEAATTAVEMVRVFTRMAAR